MKSGDKTKEEAILGIDYGEKNIGIALGRNGYVAPIKILSGKNSMTASHEITRFALENKIARFVMGLPLTEEGKETKQSLETRKFAKILKIVSKKPVQFVSEYESTKQSHAQKAMFGVTRKRNTLSDHIAAAVILKRYFDE